MYHHAAAACHATQHNTTAERTNKSTKVCVWGRRAGNPHFVLGCIEVCAADKDAVGVQDFANVAQKPARE